MYGRKEMALIMGYRENEMTKHMAILQDELLVLNTPRSR